MSSSNQGKKFEAKFEENWKSSTNNSFIYRLHDQVTGYLTTSANPCDFICFANNKLFLIECKSHNGASIPFAAIPQYERLLAYKEYDNVISGVVVWYKDKDCVLFLPIRTLEREFNQGKKSINYKIYEDAESGALLLPSRKKKIFLDTDYSILLNL